MKILFFSNAFYSPSPAPTARPLPQGEVLKDLKITFYLLTFACGMSSPSGRGFKKFENNFLPPHLRLRHVLSLRERF